MDVQEFHDLDVVLVGGLPSSGKTNFSKAFFDATGRSRINRKEIQRAFYEMTEFGKPWREADFSLTDENLVKHVERKMVEHYLQNGRKVLIDNSSVSRASRSAYLALAVQQKKTIGVVFLHPSIAGCLERNRKNPDPVPEMVISNLAARLEIPTETEGFTKVLVVRDY